MRKVADIARLFDVQSETVKKWCYHFGEHLSASATVKAKTRLFDDSDLRIFAMIYYYWEDDPDYEHIHACLNSSQQDCEKFREFSLLHSSIFRNAEHCDYVGDQAWQCGILFSDDSPLFSQIAVAQSYKAAADTLVEAIRSSHQPFNLAYPIFFTYRHSLELYLKILSQYNPKTDKEAHSLDKLIKRIEERYGEKFPTWMRDRLHDFHDIDPGSTSFRYLDQNTGVITGKYEIWVDFGHLKFVMDKLCDVFENVISKLAAASSR